MKINVNVEIFLSDEEISFLKKSFLLNTSRILNPFLVKEDNLHLLNSLVQKGIIQSDDIGNISLTVLGKLLLLEFDRNNRIDKIISD